MSNRADIVVRWLSVSAGTSARQRISTLMDGTACPPVEHHYAALLTRASDHWRLAFA